MIEKKLNDELENISFSEMEKNEMTNFVLSSKKKNPTLKIVAAFVAVYIVLLNTSSSFALKALQIPVIKQVSKVLCFNSAYLNAAHRNEILDETGYEFQLEGGTLVIQAIGYDQQSVVVRYVYTDSQQNLSTNLICMDMLDSAGGSAEGSDKGIDAVYNLTQSIDELEELRFVAYIKEEGTRVSFTIGIKKELIKESVIYPVNETVDVNDIHFTIESIDVNPINTLVNIHYDLTQYNSIVANIRLLLNGNPVGYAGNEFSGESSSFDFDSIYGKDIQSLEIVVESVEAYKSFHFFELNLSDLMVDGELGELDSMNLQRIDDTYQLVVISEESLPKDLFTFYKDVHIVSSNKTEHQHIYTFTSDKQIVEISRNKGINYLINQIIEVK